MSRSYRKTPKMGIAGHTEKWDKQKAHRKFRRQEKMYLEDDDSTEIPLTLREVSDLWGMSKDGKFRFDPKQYPKLMRK